MVYTRTFKRCLSGLEAAPQQTPLSPQASCQNRLPSRNGFTLLELLVVIVIIGLLGSALVVSVQSSYKQARQANCKSNLRQFGVALTIYRGEHDNRTPDWLSNLYPDYLDDRATYVCRADPNRGRLAPVSREYLTRINAVGGNFYESRATWDNEQGTGTTRNPTVLTCSYCYEFSAATGVNADWYTGDALPKGTTFSTIGEFKRIQMTYGDGNNRVNGVQMPYSASRIPIVRCCHHWRDQYVYGRDNATSSQIKREPITLNVAYAGNVFVGPPFWESTLYPGETASSSTQ